jgi:hypothetical protein
MEAILGLVCMTDFPEAENKKTRLSGGLVLEN